MFCARFSSQWNTKVAERYVEDLGSLFQVEDTSDFLTSSWPCPVSKKFGRSRRVTMPASMMCNSGIRINVIGGLEAASWSRHAIPGKGNALQPNLNALGRSASSHGDDPGMSMHSFLARPMSMISAKFGVGPVPYAM